jgi:hypothetical protein
MIEPRDDLTLGKLSLTYRILFTGFLLVLISTPFAFLVLDVASMWLTKFWPAFAWITMIGGFGYSLAATIMFATSFAQMWLPRWTQKLRP